MFKTTQDWHGRGLRFAATILGDSWSLIILRGPMFKGPQHSVALPNSAEGISTNVLTTRLSKLLLEGLVRKLDQNVPRLHRVSTASGGTGPLLGSRASAKCTIR